MTTSLLDRAIYSYSDVDRLVGVRPGTARRWLEGYTRAGTFYEPVLRPEPTGSDSVTWGELVEARLLAEFRSTVPVQRLRPAIELLRVDFGRYPLAHARPYLDVQGRELVRVIQDQVGLERPLQLVVVRNGQTVLADSAQRFAAMVDFDHGEARRLRPETRTPEVALDPTLAFGQPSIRSIRTESLAEDFRAGTSRDEIADLYDLALQQVDDALRYELIVSAATA